MFQPMCGILRPDLGSGLNLMTWPLNMPRPGSSGDSSLPSNRSW